MDEIGGRVEGRLEDESEKASGQVLAATVWRWNKQLDSKCQQLEYL